MMRIPTTRSRAGFTLLEVMLAIALAGMLSFGLFSLAQTAGRKRIATWRAADVHTSLTSINSALRKHVENSGRGMISTYNYGPLNVKSGSGGGAGFDTLLVLRADSATIRNASRPCQGGSTGCIVLFGDHAEHFSTGALVVTGSPATGARVLQVTGAPRVFTALCGADCIDEVFCRAPTDSELGRPASGGHTYISGHSYNGGPLNPGTCPQPFDAAGRACQEQWSSRTFERQYPDCKPQGTSADFTELSVVDRTQDFGYPLGPSAILTSATATPKIRTQRVTPTRFFVRNAGTAESELVQQVGLRGDGSWDRTISITGPVARFQVETLHQHETAWSNGVGVTNNMLALSSSNRLTTTTPGAAAAPGYTYRKAYSTVALSRVHYDLVRTRSDAGVDTISHAVILNATPSLSGGTDGGS